MECFLNQEAWARPWFLDPRPQTLHVSSISPLRFPGPHLFEWGSIPSLRTEKNLLFSNFSFRVLCSTSAINYVNVLADLFVLNTGPVSSPFISCNEHIQIKSLRGRPILAMAWQDGNKFSTLLRVTVLMVITISSVVVLLPGEPLVTSTREALV